MHPLPRTLLPLKQNPDEIRQRIAEVKAGLPLTAEEGDRSPKTEAPVAKR